MPSLPATRPGSIRGAHFSHNFSRPKPPRRSKKRLRKSLKQRLIRKYLQSTGSKSHLKHGSTSNLRALASNLAKPENPVLKSLDMALDRKNAKTERPVVAEVTAIPNPTPVMATAPLPTDVQGYGSPLLNPVVGPTSTSFLPSGTKSHTARPLATFSALPPLLSLVPSSTVILTTHALVASPSPLVVTLPPQTLDTGTHSGDSQPHPVSLAIIVLLAVGAGLLLLGSCIVIKMCTRPTRRPRPTPSLPMLNDLDPGDKFYESKESPIFGGKERLSPMQGANGPMWTWVQYPQPADKPSQSSDQDTNSSQEIPTSDPDSCSSCQTQPTTQNPASQHPQNLNRQSFLQHPPNILTNASNRLSTTSMSLYSPQTNIGLAIGGGRETGFTDGYDNMKRSKTLNKRKSQTGLEDKKRRDSTNSSIHLAYDAEVLSPVPTEYIQVRETPIINASERRERVKSSYFTSGAYPRVSTLPSGSYSIATATKVNIAHRNSFGKIPLQRSNSRRQRDPQALTHTPPKSEHMLSSLPTLYPDDSMSMAENKRPRKRNPSDRKPVETIPRPTSAVMESGLPGSETLMKMEFGVSQMSLSRLALDGEENETGRMNVSITLPLRTMDKPPRVPSPPPLPSLTQMGLAHNNPESYANYRSPTYSIYGFYENDRMSTLAR